MYTIVCLFIVDEGYFYNIYKKYFLFFSRYYDGYRRSFDSDSHPPPPRRGRGANTYSSSRYSGERKPYEEKSHEESHDKGQKVATVEGNNANNSHHQLNGHLSEDDRRGVSTGGY